MDIGDDQILWRGSWRSSNFDNVYGMIEIPLIKDYQEGYTVDGLIRFDGSYNRGKTVVVPIRVTNINLLKNHEANYLEFDTIVDNQAIKYYISIYNEEKIGGIYKSSTPPDRGTIELRPTEDKIIDYGDRKGGWCVIF